ncbi:MAG TPA: hypothetical protein VJT84_05530 [Gaiellaceae bacterium]|nr:hypothetical protein [Gaiellaceae bacterium]
MFDAVELEKLGKPTLTMGHETFEKAAHLHAEALGLPGLQLIFEPPPAGGNVPEEAPLTPDQLEFVLGALTRPGGAGDAAG